MLRYLSAFAMFLAIFFSASSNAAIMWSTDNVNFKYPSGDALCNMIQKDYAYDPFVADSYTFAIVNDFQGICNFKQVFPGTTSTHKAEAFLYYRGVCDEGTNFNSVTGSCDAPVQADGEKCKDQTGARGSVPMIFSAKNNKCMLMTDADDPAMCHYMGSLSSSGATLPYTVAGSLTSTGELAAPPTFATDGFACQLKTVSQSDCVLKIDASATCSVQAVYTGEVNPTTSNVKSNGKDLCTAVNCLDTTPTTTVQDTPCATAGNCTTETKSETTGSQGCGTFNGSFICTTIKPKSSGTKVETTTTAATNADGSVTSTQVAKTTKSTCTNILECTLRESTTTTKSTTSKSGTTTTSSTCTGSCTGTGTGSGGTGSGNGDGDEDKDEGTASASEDCKAPPACSGDKFSCAILRQSWINSCAERALPTAKQKSDFQAEIDAQKAKLDVNQKSLDDTVSGMVSNFQAKASVNTGGRCFEDKTFSFQGHAIVLPFSQACPYLEWLRYAVLAAAYLISLRIVNKEL